jgi:ABC-type transporter Mla MlaB component
MIRISSDKGAHPGGLAIAGRLEAGHVAQLEEHFQSSSNTMVLDLSELQGADAGAVCWLRGFLRRGGRIVGASPYIQLLLKRNGREAADPSGDLDERSGLTGIVNS